MKKLKKLKLTEMPKLNMSMLKGGGYGCEVGCGSCDSIRTTGWAK